MTRSSLHLVDREPRQSGVQNFEETLCRIVYSIFSIRPTSKSFGSIHRPARPRIPSLRSQRFLWSHSTFPTSSELLLGKLLQATQRWRVAITSPNTLKAALRSCHTLTWVQRGGAGLSTSSARAFPKTFRVPFACSKPKSWGFRVPERWGISFELVNHVVSLLVSRPSSLHAPSARTLGSFRRR